MSKEMKIHPGATMIHKDPVTGKKTYQGKFTLTFEGGLKGPVRELKRKFNRRNRAQKWATRLKDRYLSYIDVGNQMWQDIIKERLRIMHPQDGDLILVETTNERREMVLGNIQKIAEYIKADALFLVVGEDEHVKYADPKAMRKAGWMRTPRWWLRRITRRL